MLFPARPQSRMGGGSSCAGRSVHRQRLVEISNWDARAPGPSSRAGACPYCRRRFSCSLPRHKVDGPAPLRRRSLPCPRANADQRADPLEAGHALVEGVLLGARASQIQVRTAPDRLAQHLDVSARAELTGDQLRTSTCRRRWGRSPVARGTGCGTSFRPMTWPCHFDTCSAVGSASSPPPHAVRSRWTSDEPAIRGGASHGVA